MKKIMKKIMKITGIVFLVVIILLILTPFLFKGKILQIVKDQANQNLNAKVEFDDFNLSIFKSFPALSVELDKLSVVGIDSFATDTLVAFNKFYVDLNLMSVVAGDEIKIRAIVLDNPRINAKVLHSGKANWDIVKDTTASETEEVKEESSEETKFKIGLKRFEIINAQLIYDDKSLDVLAKITNLNFKLKGDMTQDLTVLNILSSIDSLTVKYGAVKYLNRATINFKSDIEADMKNMKFTFKENLFGLNKLGLGFDGYVSMPDTNINMDITFNAKETEFKSVLSLVPAVYMKDFQTIKTSGKFAFNGYAKGTYNAVNLPAFGIDLLVENAMFKYPDLPKSVDNININVKVDNKGGTGDDNIIDVKKFHLEIAKNPFNATMHVVTSSADVAMRGNVNGKIDLNSIQDVMPLEDMSISGLISADLSFAGNLSSIEKEQYEDFKAEGSIGLDNFVYKSKDLPDVNIIIARMMFSPQYVDLSKFDMLIGRSDMSFVGKINNILSFVFKDELLTGNFNFSSKLLDANEFVSSTDTDENNETTPDTSAITAFEIPSNINFTLNSKLNKVLYDKLEITNIDGLILLKDSKLSLDNLNMNMLKGSMKMTGSYDSKIISKPKAAFSLDISKFDIQEVYKAFSIVQEMAPISKNCVGLISTNLNFTTLLTDSLSPVLNTLNGAGGINSGSIGFHNSGFCNKFADISKMEKYRNPTLKDFNLKFTIKDGNITVEPSTTKIDNTEIEYGGSQNLDQSINYKMKVKVPRSEFGGGANDVVDNLLSKTGKDIKLGKTINLIVKVTGTLTDPKLKLSLNDGDDGGVVDQIKKELSDEAKKLIEEADKKAKELIAEAEKQAQKIKDEAKVLADKMISEADKNAKKLDGEAQLRGKQLVDEAKKQGSDLVNKAKNPFAKLAAQKSEKLMIEKAQKASNKLISESKNASNKLNSEAKSKADKLNSEAKSKSDIIVNTAKDKADKMKNDALKKADSM